MALNLLAKTNISFLQIQFKQTCATLSVPSASNVFLCSCRGLLALVKPHLFLQIALFLSVSTHHLDAGKTSLVKYLALRTGHEFVRINNHAHTDVQEYLGTYVSNSMGNLVFQEGPLVTAVRKGHWVVLDELNLAPSEVLEMLNRLLDDNRELMIPDTQEVIKPHPDFAVFATQNPTGVYDSPSLHYFSCLEDHEPVIC
jgi:hypothetical protein